MLGFVFRVYKDPTCKFFGFRAMYTYCCGAVCYYKYASETFAKPRNLGCRIRNLTYEYVHVCPSVSRRIVAVVRTHMPPVNEKSKVRPKKLARSGS